MSTRTTTRPPSSRRADVLIGSTVDVSNLFYDGIVQELDRRRRKVHVVSSGGPVASRLFGDHAQLHTLEMERGLSPLRDLRSLSQWLRLISRLRPSLLIIGTPKASLLGGIAGRVMKTPNIVYIVHGLRSEQTVGPLSMVLKLVEGLTLRCAHHVVAVSASLRREVEAAHPGLRRGIEVLGHGSLNGVDLKRFVPPAPSQRAAARRAWKLPSGTILGFVGRLERDKGGGLLADLMQDARMASPDIHLLIVGEIEDNSLRVPFDELVSSGRATITGWLEAPEKAMAAFDILLHPTRREGLGMVLLEAQAMGIPVLTHAVTGTVDALGDGVGGFFAEIDAISDWSDQIHALAVDDEQRRLRGKAGRGFVEARFARAQVVAQFIEYLRVNGCLQNADGSDTIQQGEFT